MISVIIHIYNTLQETLHFLGQILENILIVTGVGHELIQTPIFHISFLINIKYIVNINNADGSNCELKGNIMLPVAKRRKEQMVSYLNIRD